MIDGKALWAPGWGEPCDCFDDCDCADSVDLTIAAVDIDGAAWVVNPFSAVVMLRRDQVEIEGDWFEFGEIGQDVAHRTFHRLRAAEPRPFRSDAWFRRDYLQPLLDAGCRVLPTDLHAAIVSSLLIHAVMHGEDLIGWISPGKPLKQPVNTEVWMHLPASAPTSAPIPDPSGARP